jgi:hypothetical protein
MRLFLVFLLSVTIFQNPRAQAIPNGLYEAGGIFTPKISVNTPDQKIQWQKPVIMINLFPGFAAVKSSYDLFNADTLSCKVIIVVPDSGDMADPTTGTVHARPSSVIRLLVDDSLVRSRISESVPGLHYEFGIPAKKNIHLTIYQVTQNNQARLFREGESRTGNAIAFSRSPLQVRDTSPFTVMVRFMDPLTLTNVLGVSPAKKSRGDLRHLQYEASGSSFAPLVIWYEGAPPDFKFTKDILPDADVLFSEIDKFPEAEFNDPSFEMIDRYNFSTNPKNPLAAILYFMMFFSPWIILIAFIIFLLKKPKKKSIQT